MKGKYSQTSELGYFAFALYIMHHFLILVDISYLANEIYKQPVIVYEYPKEVKPFYVHVKEDGKTASAFDIISPKVSLILL